MSDNFPRTSQTTARESTVTQLLDRYVEMVNAAVERGDELQAAELAHMCETELQAIAA